MSRTNKVTRNLHEQEPGRDKCHAIAAHIPNIAENYNQRQALRLRMAHGLTEAQAQAIAALVWGSI